MSDDLVKRAREWDFCWPSHDVEMLVPAMADRIEELSNCVAVLEAKLAQVTAVYRIEVMQRGPWVSHEDFDRHIREITGDTP